MPSLKEMRSRISSVKATQKITKALQMVAAAKLRRAQEAAQNARPYAARMAAVIANLAAGVSGPGAPKLLVGTGSDRKELVVVATSDRGLAGAINSSVVRAAREHIAGSIAQGREVTILTVGRKARDQLRRLYGQRYVANVEAGNNPTLERAQEVAKLITQRFEAGDADIVTLYFSQFRSLVSQAPTSRQLIPAQVAGAPTIDLKGACYEYEPDEETILAPELQRRGIHRILLVTSNYHSRRATYLFHRIAPWLIVQTVDAPDPYFTPGTWWETRRGRKTFVLEWLKTVATWLRQ